MKKILLIIMLIGLYGYAANAQNTKPDSIKREPAISLKEPAISLGDQINIYKQLKTLMNSEEPIQQLNGVTFGFGAGYSHSLDQTYDYSLTPDGKYNLKVQGLNKNAFVISSVIMVKLGKVFVDKENNFLPKKGGDQGQDAGESNWRNRFSINLSLNLVNITSDVSFNKNVDGGLGIGYFLTPSMQVALFYDVSQKRQLRDYVLKDYENNPIPNTANTVYNALDTNDDKLFYSKTISGFSLKLVFSLANKKTNP